MSGKEEGECTSSVRWLADGRELKHCEQVERNLRNQMNVQKGRGLADENKNICFMVLLMRNGSAQHCASSITGAQ